MTADQVEAMRDRLYAALKHEKSCTCGDCSYGLNTVDDLVAIVAALRVRAAAADNLANALRPFAEKWDLHGTDYLADLIDGKEMRIVEANQIDEMNLDIARARQALAACAREETS